MLPSGVLPPTAAGEAAFQWRGHAGTVTVAVTGAMTGASAGDTADEYDRPVSKIPSQVMPVTHACGSMLVKRALVKGPRCTSRTVYPDAGGRCTQTRFCWRLRCRVGVG